MNRGVFRIMTLPKMSRLAFSKFLSNCQFLYLGLTPRDFLLAETWCALTIPFSFANPKRSGVCSCCLHHSSFSAMNRAQYSLHSWRIANCTSWHKSAQNSPDGIRKLSKRNKEEEEVEVCDVFR